MSYLVGRIRKVQNLEIIEENSTEQDKKLAQKVYIGSLIALIEQANDLNSKASIKLPNFIYLEELKTQLDEADSQCQNLSYLIQQMNQEKDSLLILEKELLILESQLNKMMKGNCPMCLQGCPIQSKKYSKIEPVTKYHVEWAWDNRYFSPLQRHVDKFHGNHHWSRMFEYPWVLIHGNFHPGLDVLDAGGGDGPLSPIIYMTSNCMIINMDLDHTRNTRWDHLKGITKVVGDILKTGFKDNSFDRVICVSVIEHTPNPFEILHELWRVTKPGGRLLVTLDVADYSRHNHIVDLKMAKEILKLFGLEVPKEPWRILTAKFKEEERQEHEPTEVNLKVICFWVEKPL